MARKNRGDVFSPFESAIAHVMCRVVRRCRLMGNDPVTGKNYDHRKRWIEDLLRHHAAYFGIDLLCYAILCNHMHLILRTNPAIVQQWSDAEVARRWLMLCPKRKLPDGSPAEPNQNEINTIVNDAGKMAEIRSRLSDISWWMRLMNQKIAQRANAEEEIKGHFWEARFRALLILDLPGLLACSVYVDLNVLRAALAETLEASEYTSIKRRLQTLQQPDAPPEQRPDRFLAPLTIEALRNELGPNASGFRCSDNGFLDMSLKSYIELLDWTARQVIEGKAGFTPADTPEILQRLGLRPEVWCELSGEVENLFSLVAGQLQSIDAARTINGQSCFHARTRTRELLSA